MSLAEQMLTDAAIGGVFLNTEEHAATYKYTPPQGGLSRDVVGVWNLQEPKEDPMNGMEIVHTGTLEINQSETIERSGVFRIEGFDWPVKEVGTVLVGMRCITCERRDKIRTGAGNKQFGK